MGYYLIAIGGTGNKILESSVYAAAADMFHLPGKNGERVPLPCLRMLSVDVDAACGNTTRAKLAADQYEKVRSAFDGFSYSHQCFHTALRLDKWTMDLSRRVASVNSMSQNHTKDRLLARTLFSPTEASLEYSEGFRGHPDLGVLYFADLFASLDRLRAEGQQDEFNDLLDEIDADIARGESAHVILCGSIFGGTGASGIPALANCLRARYADRRERFQLGGMLMLPYYTVPPANVDESREIAVNSEDFLDKARTALQYYGMEGLIRDNASDEKGVFDAVYLLGLPREYFISCANHYATGSRDQENDAHLMEWLASCCVASFFRTDFRGENARNIDCYYYQCHEPVFGWESLGEDGAHARARYGALLKAAAVCAAECYPTLSHYLKKNDRKAGIAGYVANFFPMAGSLAPDLRTELEDKLDALQVFFRCLCRWFRQVIRCLPPQMTLGPGEGALPRNGLLDPALLEMLCALIDPSGDLLPAERESYAEKLQKDLQHLLVRTVPDPCGIGRVIRGLNGADVQPGSVLTRFASFLAVLLDTMNK